MKALKHGEETLCTGREETMLYLLAALREEFPAEALKVETVMPAALFIGIFPGGISYCDSTREEHGDYKKIAFLPYSTLELEIYAPKSKLLPAIKEHAAGLQARRGESFEISTCGQTVRLGGRDAR